MAEILEFKFDTQLLIEGHDLDEDAINDYITEHFKGDCLLEVNPRVWGSFPMTEVAQSPFTAYYARAAAGERVRYTAQDYRSGVRMRFLLNDTLAALHYLRAGRVGIFLRSIADLFTAKEALRCRGDNRVFWVYLKNSLFARG